MLVYMYVYTYNIDVFRQLDVIGGVDGQYTYINSSDLRPYKEKSGAQFLLQAMHTTLSHHYNDTLNFLLLSNSTKDTVVHVRGEGGGGEGGRGGGGEGGREGGREEGREDKYIHCTFSLSYRLSLYLVSMAPSVTVVRTIRILWAS